MRVCGVFRFSNGYVVLLDTFTNGKRNAYKFSGVSFGTDFPMISQKDFESLHCKVIRSASEFAKYLKAYNPNGFYNPVNINGVVFDLPFIHFPNGYRLTWQPEFEKSVSKSSFNILSQGAIIEYNFEQPIFISTLSMKRHTPKVNMERLLINTNTGLVTKDICKACTDKYYEAQYRCDNGVWSCFRYDEVAIAGFKMR